MSTARNYGYRSVGLIQREHAIPTGAGQQMLQTIRGRRSTVLGDGPAIFAVQASNHPGQQLARMPQRLGAGGSRRDPIQDRRELRLPPIRVYAMNRGDRGIFYCLHKH